jgi:hypothetical protein
MSDDRGHLRAMRLLPFAAADVRGCRLIVNGIVRLGAGQCGKMSR